MKTSGIDFLVTCTWRSPEEQSALWAKGRTYKAGIWSVTDSKKVVTWVQAGNSAHNFMVAGKPAALAFDIVVLIDGKPQWDARHPSWKLAIQHGKDAGLKNLFPKESAHFEYPNWRKVGLVKNK